MTDSTTIKETSTHGSTVNASLHDRRDITIMTSANDNSVTTPWMVSTALHDPVLADSPPAYLTIWWSGGHLEVYLQDKWYSSENFRNVPSM
ncbi:hypothetical protein J6590_075344 [Homalodisca vitripennis]|nr:hypothetical protein J6590_075344 [Homalodisca vitripennis]